MRRSATAFVALTLTAALGCASRSRGTRPQAAAGAAPSTSGSSASPASAHVQEAAFSEDADGARLVLSANAPLLYTAYEPRPDLLIVDLPGIGLADGFSAPRVSGELVSNVTVEPILEMGKPLTRLTVAHREGARFDIRSLGQGLAISFDSPGQAAAAEAMPSAVTASPSLIVETQEIGAGRAQARGEPAHALEEIRATPGRGVVTVTLLGDGTFAPRTFALGNPPRVVIDLPGVKNEVRKRAITVASGLVSRIRVSQFATSPEMVTRIVLDLSRPLPHVLRADGERLAVVVGEGVSQEAAAASGATRPRAPSPSRTEIAEQKQAQAQARTASFPPADMPAAPPVQAGQTRPAPSDPSPAQPLPAAPSGTTTSMTTTTTEAAPAPPQEAPAMARESKSEPAPAAAEAAPIERTERPASAPPP
ncbi:MAG: AMIN domain-containing protein, partial [Acidobacteriota bacterium]|nr:AMIN domain-containing protein [Acidobacteriota bacterium]